MGGSGGASACAGSSLVRDIVRCLMIVVNSAGAQCARVRLGTARSGADARRLSSPRTVRCVAGGVSPVACAVAVASNSSTLEYSVLICSTEHSAGNCGPTLFVQRLRVHGLPSLCLRTSSSCGYMSRILRRTLFVVRAALFPAVGSVTRLVSSTRIARDSRFLTLLSATLQ